MARMAGHDVCNRGAALRATARRAGRQRGCDRGSGEARRGIRRSGVAQEGSPTTMSGLNLVQVAVEAESAGRQSGQNGPGEPTLVGRHAQALVPRRSEFDRFTFRPPPLDRGPRQSIKTTAPGY